MYKTIAANTIEIMSPKARISRNLVTLFNTFEGKDEEYISKKIAENIDEILFVIDSPNCKKNFRENIGTCPGIDGGYISGMCSKHISEYESNMKKLKPFLKQYKSIINNAEKAHIEQSKESGQPEA